MTREPPEIPNVTLLRTGMSVPIKEAKAEPTPFKPDTMLSWGKPPEGFYNQTAFIGKPYQYQVIMVANPAQVFCPIHVK